jgi:hypothetical protein
MDKSALAPLGIAKLMRKSRDPIAGVREGFVVNPAMTYSLSLVLNPMLETRGFGSTLNALAVGKTLDASNLSVRSKLVMLSETIRSKTKRSPVLLMRSINIG